MAERLAQTAVESHQQTQRCFRRRGNPLHRLGSVPEVGHQQPLRAHQPQGIFARLLELGLSHVDGQYVYSPLYGERLKGGYGHANPGF